MHRFSRRAIVLQGRRSITLDPAEATRSTARAQMARAVRVALRQGRAVVLRTTRWDAVSWWLDDLTIDLAAGAPALAVGRVDLSTVSKGDAAGTEVAERLAAALGMSRYKSDDILTREAFTSRARDLLLVAGKGQTARVLVFEDADRIGAHMTADLIAAWRDARRRVPAARMPRLVITARFGGVPIDAKHVVEHSMVDPTEDEAVDMLADMLGHGQPDRLRMLVRQVGPVPAFLARVGMADRPFEAAGIQEALAPLQQEIHAATDGAMAQDATRERFTVLAAGAQPLDARLDRVLMRSGLVAMSDSRAWVRSPIFLGVLRTA